MKIYFEQMFRYERWANDRVLTYLCERPDNPPLLAIFHHLVADALPWVYVLRGETVPESVLQTIGDSARWSAEECRMQLEMLQDNLDRYVESLSDADLNRTVYSIGPHGQQYPNTVAEVLTHILSHGQHHRGQIEWLAEQGAGVYLATSLMPYLRQGGKI